MPIVEYNDVEFDFPEGSTPQQIEQVIRSYREGLSSATDDGKPDSDMAMRSEQVTPPTESYFPADSDQTSANLPSLNAEQQRFVDAIAEVETGGIENRSVRTMQAPSRGGQGSSAYGTYQVTHGLLSRAMDTGYISLSPEEEAAARELLARQKVGLAVGGRDRAKYEAGGSKHARGKKWAKQYGYDNVQSFLDDFDYGGTYGLADDEDFQMLYESFGRKLLVQHLKDANGDAERAAAVWYAGPKAGKKSDGYVKKFRKAYEGS